MAAATRSYDADGEVLQPIQTNYGTGAWSVTIPPNEQTGLDGPTLRFEVRVEFSSGVVSVQNYGDLTVTSSLFDEAS